MENQTYVYGDYEDGYGIFSKIAISMQMFGEAASVPCLLITFIVYTIIPELRNIHGLTLRGYVGCEFMAYATIVVFSITIYQNVILSCGYWGTTFYFLRTASYFWLNVMCFDIWWTFGRFRPPQRSKTHNRHNFKQFIFYSIYVWGSTVSVTTIWVLVTFGFGSSETEDDGNKPTEWCLFVNDWYIYGPIGVTLLCNVILFVITVAKIIRHNKDTAHHLEGTVSRRADDNKSWFILYMKLFLVMGINWFSRLGSWLSEDSKYVHHIPDIVSAYQGVIIFIMFICKRKILRWLIKRCRCRSQIDLSQHSRRSHYHDSTSRNSATPSTSREKANSSVQRF